MGRFKNTMIIPVCASKPHIIYIDGWWRVSSLKRAKAPYTYRNWLEAHEFTNKLNDKLKATRPWGYRRQECAP